MKTWALYGQGLIGSELRKQLEDPKISSRLGLKNTPEFVVRSKGCFDSSGNKCPIPKTIPDVGFFAMPSTATGNEALKFAIPILENGGIVITAEKGMMANHFSKLKTLSNNFARCGVNATVGGGTRMMQAAKVYASDLENITQIHMVINGTLTKILSSIGPETGAGVSLGQAVDEAIILGFAEPGATTPAEVLSSEAKGDLPKKTAIVLNVLGIASNISWKEFEFEITEKEINRVEEESRVRRAIVSLYNTKSSSVTPETDIIGGFGKMIGNWNVVAGFRDVTKNPLFGNLAGLTGPGNGFVIGLGPNESDGVYSCTGPGAGPKPTVNTMLDDYVRLCR